MAFTTDLVADKFNEASSYADSAWEAAIEFLGELGDAAQVEPPQEAILNYTFNPLTDPGVSVEAPPTPTFGSLTTTRPTPDGIDEPVLSTVIVPTNTMPTLTIDAPTKPSVADPADPGDPTVGTVSVPAKPTFSFPSEPSLGTPTMPTRPSLTIPRFTTAAPVDDIVTPTNNFNYLEIVYQSDLLDSVKVKLAADLAVGGTGLGATAEAAIWDRAQDRQDELDEKLFDQTLEFFSSRGWNWPTGAMAARLAEAHNESRRSSEKLNNDILVQQSQLAYQNIKDTITSIIGLEQALIQHADTVANRSLEASKYVVEAAVNICNAQIAKLNAAIERYKAIATVYETETRVQGLLLDFYGKELASAELENQIGMTEVEKYKALLSGIQAQAGIYETEMKGAAIAADFESKKLEGFKLLVDVFVAKINANTQKYNQYAAEWQGEATRVAAYAETTKAFGIMMEGAGIQANVNKIIADISASINDSRSKNYATEVEAYRAELQGEIALIDAEAKVFSAQGGMYESDAKVAVSKAEMNLKANEANLRMLLAQLELELKAAEINIQNMQQSNQLAFEAAKAGADVTSRMASAALSSVNASASQGVSSSESYDQTKDVHTYSHSMTSECNEC